MDYPQVRLAPLPLKQTHNPHTPVEYDPYETDGPTQPHAPQLQPPAHKTPTLPYAPPPPSTLPYAPPPPPTTSSSSPSPSFSPSSWNFLGPPSTTTTTTTTPAGSHSPVLPTPSTPYSTTPLMAHAAPHLYVDDTIKVQVPLDFDLGRLSLGDADYSPLPDFASLPLRFAEGESNDPVERVGYVDDTRFSGGSQHSRISASAEDNGNRVSAASVSPASAPVVLPSRSIDSPRSSYHPGPGAVLPPITTVPGTTGIALSSSPRASYYPGNGGSVDSPRASFHPGVVLPGPDPQSTSPMPRNRKVGSTDSTHSTIRAYAANPNSPTYPQVQGPIQHNQPGLYQQQHHQQQQSFQVSGPNPALGPGPGPGPSPGRASMDYHPPHQQPLQRPTYRGAPPPQQQQQQQPHPHRMSYINTGPPPHDPRYQQQQHPYPGGPNGGAHVQQQRPYGADHGPEYYQDPYYGGNGGGGYPANGYDNRPGYRPPQGPGYGPPQQLQGRPGANLAPSSSMRSYPGRPGGGPPPPRPAMMGPGGGPSPYGGRPPPMGPPGRVNGAGPGPGPGHGPGPPPAAGGPPQKRVLTLEVLDEMRQYAKDSRHPAAQLDYAKALIEAAVTFGNDDPDPKRQKKNKEALFMEGLKIIKRLATSGSGIGRPAYPDAQFFLANCYGNGSLGLQIDHDKAFNLYIQASKQHHPASTYRAGVCYELGAGTKRDQARAVQYYRKAAALGDTAAMYKLGMIQLKGLLGQQGNPREAISWLKRAAAQADEENPHALHELGLCFEKAGIPTVIPDEAYSRELFTQAAGLGYAPSQFKLGHCYEYGTLTCPVDPRRSIAWYTRAAEQGDAESELGLSGWYLTGAEGVLKQSDTEAYLWARKAADKGLARGEYAVGYYSEVGIGVKQDLDEARRWYQRAAAQGNNRAKKRLTDMKRLGAMRRMRHDRARQGAQGSEDDNCKVM